MSPETPAIFNGQPVRIVASDLGPVIPVPDIARVIGCDRSNMTRMIRSNSHLFEGLTSVQTLQSTGGHQKTVCLSRDGVLGILMKVHPGRAHDDDTAQKIAAFQRWAVKTLGEIIERGRAGGNLPALISTPPPAPAPASCTEALESEFEIAALINERTGVPIAELQRTAIIRAGRKINDDMEDYAALIPSDSTIEGAGYLTPTEIGTRCGMTPQKVNDWLCGQGLQRRMPGSNVFEVLPKGRPFSRLVPWSDGPRHGYQIKWSDEVLMSIPGGRQQQLAIAEGS